LEKQLKRAAGESPRNLASEMGLTTEAVENCVARRTWRNVV
jgi:hypothetical protein